MPNTGEQGNTSFDGCTFTPVVEDDDGIGGINLSMFE